MYVLCGSYAYRVSGFRYERIFFLSNGVFNKAPLYVQSSMMNRMVFLCALTFFFFSPFADHTNGFGLSLRREANNEESKKKQRIERALAGIFGWREPKRRVISTSGLL